jgi:hypothetical protein
MTDRALKTQETWLKNLGVKFVDVWFYHPKAGVWTCEPQVADPLTIEETVNMALTRLKATYALRTYEGRWLLIKKFGGVHKHNRYYDTREAAEMVAIHGV